MDKTRVITAFMTAAVLVPCFAVYAAPEKTGMKSQGTIVYADGDEIVKIYGKDIAFLTEEISSIPDTVFDPAIFSTSPAVEEMMPLQDDVWENTDDLVETEEVEAVPDPEMAVSAAVEVGAEGRISKEWILSFVEQVKAAGETEEQIGEEENAEEQAGTGYEKNTEKQAGVGDEADAEEQTEVGGEADAVHKVQVNDHSSQNQEGDSRKDYDSVSSNHIAVN